MCGIAGIVQRDPSVPSPEIARAMASAIAHRGPDASGVAPHAHATLAHTRLSIIDLAAGSQPMRTADDRFTVTYNGEVFNYVEIRQELEALGIRFRTHSDTEVVLLAFATWGPDCVARFRGQFAFAIWDSRDKSLFLARDRQGIRPLFYSLLGDRLVFASEIKALFAHPDVRRELSPRGLAQIFTTWTALAPDTAFQDVLELPPGHRARWKNGRLEIERYYAHDYAIDQGPTEEEWAEMLADALDRAATEQLLRADVPVGAYVSGGLDSSVIASLVKEKAPHGLRTFSVAFDDEVFDESAHQRAVVESLGVSDHHVVVSRADERAHDFARVVWHAEAPIVRTAPAPLFRLSSLVRSTGFKVVLTGEGADEWLGGYDIYKEAKVRRFLLRQPSSKCRAKLLGKLYPYMPQLRRMPAAYLARFFHARPEDAERLTFSHLPRWAATQRAQSLWSSEFRGRVGDYDVESDLMDRLGERLEPLGEFTRAELIETSLLLPTYLLSSQGDRMMMAHGVEGRFPFLDERVTALASRMPPRVKMRVLNEKAVLKRAARGRLPASILERHKQPYRAPGASTFIDPESGRFRAEWVGEMLSDSSLRKAGVFDPKAVRILVDKAKRGQVVGEADSMALCLVLSAQLAHAQLVLENGPLVP